MRGAKQGEQQHGWARAREKESDGRNINSGGRGEQTVVHISPRIISRFTGQWLDSALENCWKFPEKITVHIITIKVVFGLI